MTELMIGRSSGSSSAWSKDYLSLSKYQAVKSATLSELQFYSTLATNFGVAIYADNAGNPGTLLASGFGSHPTGGSWTSVAVTCDIVKDSYYWLAFIFETGSNGYSVISATWKTLKYKNVSYSGFSFPNPPTGLNDYANWDVMVGGWGTEAASGNPFYAYAQQ